MVAGTDRHGSTIVSVNEPGVLMLLAEHELSIKRLYEAFADAFAERRDFWQDLAREEQGHADYLGTLASVPEADGRLQLGGALKHQAIKSSIAYVEGQIARARNGALTPVQALAIAKDLEHALIEDVFFRVPPSAPADVRLVLTRLAEDTRRHRDSLAGALEAERQGRA